MSERRLATVETILALDPIPGADMIEKATVRGWELVTQKGKRVGDVVLYLEVDSMLDVNDPRFSFLAKGGIRTSADGFTGHKLRTIRLRGQLSQGLLLPIEEFPEIENPEVGMDVTELLGIRKYEPPMPACLAGKVRGNLPPGVRKTDAERAQNVKWVFPLTDEFYCSEKLDGSSATVTIINGEVHVCSRNLDLKEDEGNTYWQLAHRYNIPYILQSISSANGDAQVVIQGEIYGNGLNGNRLQLPDQRFAVFNLEIGNRRIPVAEWSQHIGILPRVPMLNLTPPATLEEGLAQVDKLKSAINPNRAAEGVVWRRRDGEEFGDRHRYLNLKILSNNYLLKNDE